MRWTDNWMPESADVVGITYYYHYYEYHRFEFQCANLIFRVFFFVFSSHRRTSLSFSKPSSNLIRVQGIAAVSIGLTIGTC